MAAVPQHVKIAKREGAIAGVESLHETLSRNTNDGTNGLPAAREMLAEIRKAGGFRKRTGDFKSPEKAAKWYCNHFNAKFKTGNLPLEKAAQTRTTRTRKAASQTTATTANPTEGPVAQQLLGLLEGLGIDVSALTGDTEVEDDDTDDDAEVIQGVRSRRVNRTTTTDDTEDAPVTYPPPRDPDAPATQGKLWKLNAEGPDAGIYLCVIDGDGNILAGGESPISAGEAYDLIGEHIA